MKVFSLIAALLISGVLAATAVGKLLRPWDLIVLIDRGGAILELFFAALLLLFHRKERMWLASALLFGTWGGYSLYWTLQELPCTCMGTLVEFPRGFFLGVDVVFYLMSMTTAYLIGKDLIRLFWGFFYSIWFALFGYFFAEWCYARFVLPTI